MDTAFGAKETGQQESNEKERKSHFQGERRQFLGKLAFLKDKRISKKAIQRDMHRSNDRSKGKVHSSRKNDQASQKSQELDIRILRREKHIDQKKTG
jgi:hypothetical protein